MDAATLFDCHTLLCSLALTRATESLFTGFANQLTATDVALLPVNEHCDIVKVCVALAYMLYNTDTCAPTPVNTQPVIVTVVPCEIVVASEYSHSL